MYLNLFLGYRLYQCRLSRSTLHQKQKIYRDKTTTLSFSNNLWDGLVTSEILISVKAPRRQDPTFLKTI